MTMLITGREPSVTELLPVSEELEPVPMVISDAAGGVVEGEEMLALLPGVGVGVGAGVGVSLGLTMVKDRST